MIRSPNSSTQYVQVPVVGPEDPTAQLVQFSFPAHGAEPASWHDGSWSDDDADDYLAQCLVGPDGGVDVGVGDFDVYLRFSLGDEAPVLPGGRHVRY